MEFVKAFLLLAAFTVKADADNYDFKQSVGMSAGNRVDGDEFLFISHKMSPFFLEKSRFSVTFEYVGGNDIANITEVEIRSYGAMGYELSEIAFGEKYARANITMNNVYATENIMKVYGFRAPRPA